MNERIRLLAGQAGFNEYINENLWPEEQPEFNNLMEKFAELIVRECSDVAHKCILEDGSDFPMKSVAYRIKEHFGVDK